MFCSSWLILINVPAYLFSIYKYFYFVFISIWQLKVLIFELHQSIHSFFLLLLLLLFFIWLVLKFPLAICIYHFLKDVSSKAIFAVSKTLRYMICLYSVAWVFVYFSDKNWYQSLISYTKWYFIGENLNSIYIYTFFRLALCQFAHVFIEIVEMFIWKFVIFS